MRLLSCFGLPILLWRCFPSDAFGNDALHLGTFYALRLGDFLQQPHLRLLIPQEAWDVEDCPEKVQADDKAAEGDKQVDDQLVSEFVVHDNKV